MKISHWKKIFLFWKPLILGLHLKFSGTGRLKVVGRILKHSETIFRMLLGQAIIIHFLWLKFDYQSGLIIRFHQSSFPWNKEDVQDISLLKKDNVDYFSFYGRISVWIWPWIILIIQEFHLLTSLEIHSKSPRWPRIHHDLLRVWWAFFAHILMIPVDGEGTIDWSKDTWNSKKKTKTPGDTVDGQNPAPPRMMIIPVFIIPGGAGFRPSTVFLCLLVWYGLLKHQQGKWRWWAVHLSLGCPVGS